MSQEIDKMIEKADKMQEKIGDFVKELKDRGHSSIWSVLEENDRLKEENKMLREKRE